MMLMLALGDSITYGYGASAPEKRFADRLRARFARQMRTTLHVQAKPGWTARQLFKSLQDLPACIVEEAEIVTLMIGGNDLLRSAPALLTHRRDVLEDVMRRTEEDVERLVEWCKRPHSTFGIATLYNPFPNFSLAEDVTQAYNDRVRRIALRHGLVVVEAYKAFRGHEQEFVEHYRSGQFRDLRLFRNPIHPTDEGHEALAKSFFQALQRARSKERARAASGRAARRA
ncbi:SGNH/GDSL hydrolase family protein [Alicyclobacillus vulcanalis]|uniref:Lysophospholipase L1 n=1 Tax=Alicyclobacillus vulcanalis TaxID=252246 RepID=A0A1N7LB80_9BACL|nr:SGNH/GDSL hydrolase family protein [Alicyclobacillus vulcanalis]SIS71049.1 Lysophospholipase L1 [Alicyclobacillus vulcanalis]